MAERCESGTLSVGTHAAQTRLFISYIWVGEAQVNTTRLPSRASGVQTSPSAKPTRSPVTAGTSSA